MKNIILIFLPENSILFSQNIRKINNTHIQMDVIRYIFYLKTEFSFQINH
jgi:hypothetical protein